MRPIFPCPVVPARPAAALRFALAAAAAGLALAGRSAQAQVVVPIGYHEPVVSVRGGFFFPVNGRISSQVSKALVNGGIDIALAHETYVSRTILSVDYLDRTNNDRKFRMIPITVGQFTYMPSTSQFRPYYGFGIGVYLIDQNIINSDEVAQEKSDTGYGGYIGVGSDIGQTFFVEGRYQFVTPVNGSSASGPQLNVGVRF